MSEPFIGEIRVFSGATVPAGWILCEGQQVSIADYNALYTVISTVYGASDRVNFTLPDLRQTAPLHPGKGEGLGNYQQGQRVGESEVTLTVDQMGNHSHSVMAAETAPDTTLASDSYLARAVGREENRYQNSLSNVVPIVGIKEVGTGNAHNNLQPYQALKFMIAFQGVYPPHG